MSRYHAPPALREAGTIFVREASAPGTPSEELFPYDLAYRRRIDIDMTDLTIDYIQRKAQEGRPFFAFVGLTRTHFPNLPSEEFEGRSRIGGYGDCVMELDWNVGRVQKAVIDAGIDDDTIIVFCSDNGPTTTATLPDEMHLASAGPWRGELGDAWEGSIRTVGMVRWPGRLAPHDATGTFSITDFLPTFARILGVDLPSDRPFDGIDQFDYLSRASDTAGRESLLTFIGDRLAAVRWNQWRMYPMVMGHSDNNPSLGGYLGTMTDTAGYPMAFNIEADPREMRSMLVENTWLMRPYGQAIGVYQATLADHPNPPTFNLTHF